MDLEFEPLDVITLIIIALLLFIIFLANHLLKKQTKKTMDNINYMLDQELVNEEIQKRSSKKA